MPDDLIGELSKVTILDLVSPLMNRRNSGMVLVRGTHSGELYLEAGNIVHAKTGDAVGDEAALAMINWDKGFLIFDWESTTDERTVHLSTEQLLKSWTDREQEWKGIREVIPSGQVTFRIRTDSTGEDRHIPGNQWRILTLSNGTRNVAEIAAMLGWDLFDVSKAICRMVEAGLLERVEEADSSSRQTMNEDFFPRIERGLKKLLGPIGQFIADDKLAELGESKSAFPRHQAETPAKAITGMIGDDAKRNQFETKAGDRYRRASAREEETQDAEEQQKPPGLLSGLFKPRRKVTPPIKQLDAREWFEKGFRLLYTTDDCEGAARAFTLSIQLDSTYVRAYVKRAQAYERLGNLQQAVEDYGEAILVNPDDGKLYHLRGLALRRLGMYDEAVADMRKAADRNYRSAYGFLKS